MWVIRPWNAFLAVLAMFPFRETWKYCWERVSRPYQTHFHVSYPFPYGNGPLCHVSCNIGYIWLLLRDLWHVSAGVVGSIWFSSNLEDYGMYLARVSGVCFHWNFILNGMVMIPWQSNLIIIDLKYMFAERLI